MADPDALTETAQRVRVPGWMISLCHLFAGIGGAVLLFMMLMTVTSVIKRGLLGSPIPGDYEMVEIASAVAIFCFLPICQVQGGNVLVDFFTQKSSARMNHLLEALGDLLYLLIAAILAWRLYHGAIEMKVYSEQTMVLRIPIWTSFIIILPAMAVLVLTCATTVIGHLREARK